MISKVNKTNKYDFYLFEIFYSLFAGVIKPKGTFFPGTCPKTDQEIALQALVSQSMASGII